VRGLIIYNVFEFFFLTFPAGSFAKTIPYSHISIFKTCVKCITPKLFTLAFFVKICYVKHSMATALQEKTASKWLEMVGKTKNPAKIKKGEILREVGSPPSMQKNPQKVFNSKGFKQTVDKCCKEQEIDRKSVLSLLAEIAHDRDEKTGKIKDKRASKEAIAEICKVMGYYSPIKQEIDDFRDKRTELIKPE